MQSNLLQKSLVPVTLSIKASTGQVTQVRNHVKVYPWRHNRLNRECYLDNTKTPYTDRHNINEFTKKKQRKDWQIVIPKDKDNRFNAYKWNESYKSDPAEAKQIATSRLQSFKDSLEARGPARETIAYDPPEQVEERVLALLKSSQPVTASNDELLNINLDQARTLKFNLITKCIDTFQHDLPSSYLNDINTVRDLVQYYSTPVRGINPYSALLRKEDTLPVNLHLISDPIRFDKETDQYFDGLNAFPGLVCKVSGVRGGKNYKTLNQDEFQWPDI